MQVKLSELTLDPNNVRKHSKRNLEAIRESLTRFGQVKPIVISQNHTVIAGNGTVEAARVLGWDEVEAVFFDGNVDEAKAYAIADNRTAALADWDNEGLLAQLEDFEADLVTAAGFNQTELDDLMKAFGTPDLDDLADSVGDPFGDGKVRVSFRVSEDQAKDWKHLLASMSQQDDDSAAAALIEWAKAQLPND